MGRPRFAPGPTARPSAAPGVRDSRLGLPKSPRPTASGSTECRSASTLISASTQSLMVFLSPSASSCLVCRTTRPVHVLDHLERRTQHRVVVAHRDGAGHRNRGVGQRGHHPVFARHVVCRRGQPVQRRPAQHPLGGVVVHQERQVGPAARDELSAQLAGAGNADGAQVTVQGVEVKPLQRRWSLDLSTTAGFAAADPIRARSR